MIAGRPGQRTERTERSGLEAPLAILAAFLPGSWEASWCRREGQASVLTPCGQLATLEALVDPACAAGQDWAALPAARLAAIQAWVRPAGEASTLSFPLADLRPA